MKNKKLLYLLIPINVIVWGYIGYTFLKSLNIETNIQLSSEYDSQISNVASIPDTFSLLNNNKNPFKDIFFQRKNIKHKNSPNTSSVTNKTKINTSKRSNLELLPAVRYNGLVKNQKTKKMLAIVTINNTDHLLKIGDTINRTKLLNIFKDSIIVRFNKEKLTIKKD